MFEELKKNLQSLWAGLDRRRRIGAGVASVVALMAIVGGTVWVLTTSYETLFADLEERDAAAVVAELKQSKVPYRMADNGRKILVPERHVHETRIRLMGKGVLTGGAVGFEIFDNKELGMTEYTQKINYQRALQGELARSIMAVESVKLARVHLVLPEASLFKRDKGKPKASVSLVLRPGGKLQPQQIVGIQRLVAASTPGLEAGAVTILDQHGVTLSPQLEGEETGVGASAKLRMKNEVETYLTRKIVEVMDRTYGPGQAIVSVDVALNFDEIRRTDQEVVPATAGRGEATGVVVRKRQSIYQQNRDGTAKVVDSGDVPARPSNVNSTNEIEYEVSRRVQQVVTAPGGVRRISVGVLLPKAPGEDQISKVRQIVTMVAGLNDERGDAIAVHGVDQLLGARPESAVADKKPDMANTPDTGWLATWLARVGIDPATKVPVWLVAGLAAFAIFFLGLVIWLVAVRRRPATDGQLSARERRQLLAEVQQWMDHERQTAQEVAKS